MVKINLGNLKSISQTLVQFQLFGIHQVPKARYEAGKAIPEQIS